MKASAAAARNAATALAVVKPGRAALRCGAAGTRGVSKACGAAAGVASMPPGASVAAVEAAGCGAGVAATDPVTGKILKDQLPWCLQECDDLGMR